MIFFFVILVIDANGKPPSGLLNFILTWEGDYEECLRITAETFKGQYCLGSFLITGIPNPVKHTTNQIIYNMSESM